MGIFKYLMEISLFMQVTSLPEEQLLKLLILAVG
jgi:hypothetical protein